MRTRRNFLRNASLGFLGLPSFKESPSSLPSLAGFSQLSDSENIFALVRQSLLLPKDRVYLNTGSLGPSPRQVVNRIAEILYELEKNPVGNNWGHLGRQMEEVRQNVADFISAEKEEIILTRNTTEGINLIGSCLALAPGDEILTTTHEHGGGENGLYYLQERAGAVIKKVEIPFPATSPQEVLEAIEAGISDRTRVLLLSHVSTITGLRMPFTQITQLTRPRNILLLADGAQAPGQIPVNVKDLEVDVYTSSGHKWLLGPKETGFLYLRKGIQEQINPVFTRNSNKAYSAASGTRNVASIIALGETLDWHRNIGIKKIEHRCLELANYCIQKIEKIEGLQVISPRG